MLPTTRTAGARGVGCYGRGIDGAHQAAVLPVLVVTLRRFGELDISDETAAALCSASYSA